MRRRAAAGWSAAGASSDAAALRRFLSRVSRRSGLLAAGRGAAAGLAAAAVLALIVGPAETVDRLVVWSAALAGCGAAASWAFSRATRAGAGNRRGAAAASGAGAAAYRVERGAPGCRNLLITAAELLDRPQRVQPSVGAVVLREARRLADRLSPATLLPARVTVAGVLAAALVCSAAIARAAAQPGAVPGNTPEAGEIEAAEIARVDVTITPPRYAAVDAASLRDPSRVEALAGSRVTVAVRGSAKTMTLETIGGTHEMRRGEDGVFLGELLAESDGYIAIDAAAAAGPSVRKLIGLSVRADRSPVVRVSAPGRDLFLADGNGSVEVEVQANDDIGLATLLLRYTKVTGSGEQFTFADGELPLEMARRDVRDWSGRATLRLAALGLEAGDVLVYRGVAADGRPGSAEVESDAYIIEIRSPGEAAIEGFAMDDEEDRYAISQQMVILQTERLIARAASLDRDSVVGASRRLAAEQRTVRAEFVFMMGGELAEEIEEANLGDLNEEDHAAADDEAIAGRLENQGRFALIRAIRAMSRAYAALNDAQLDSALVQERLALDHLQRAFSRTRYILRALTEREELDLERRLSGERSDARPFTRSAEPPHAGARSGELLAALGGVAHIASARRPGQAEATQATRLAEAVLRADPSAPAHQRVAGLLTEAAAVMSAGEDAGMLLDRAATELAALARSSLARTPEASRSIEIDRLDGALADLLRTGGRR